jgi:hypothetical protein
MDNKASRNNNRGPDPKKERKKKMNRGSGQLLSLYFSVDNTIGGKRTKSWRPTNI